MDNRQTATFTIPRFESDNINSGTFRNWGTLNVTSDSIVVASDVTLEENGLLNTNDVISHLRVLGYTNTFFPLKFF